MNAGSRVGEPAGRYELSLLYRPFGQYAYLCFMPRTKISREQLLEVAWSLIHRNGYRATSIAAVSAEAGIGKAGVLHHFGSKEAMMQAVIVWARRKFNEYVLSAFAKTGVNEAGEPWTIERRLSEALRRQFRLARRENAGCFFANSILEVGVETGFSESLNGFVEDWLAALGAMLAERFPAAEAHERAYRYFTDYQGSVMLFKVSGDIEHLKRFKERAVAMLAQPIVLTPTQAS